MGKLKGDFISFSFNNVDSSELGIVRVSEGDRYNQYLSPEFEDQIVQIPGGDGSYYFGSSFSQKTIDIPIAFDSITEKEFRRLNSFFNDKKIHDLIFYECPYKVYKARVSEAPQLEYICFDDIKNNRVYKGEGNISFICYNPFATSRAVFLEEFTGGENGLCTEWDNFELTADEEAIEDKIYFTANEDLTLFTPCLVSGTIPEDTYYEGGNINEWATASGITFSEENSEEDLEENLEEDVEGAPASEDATEISSLYNPGDLETDFKLYISVDSSTNISISLNNTVILKLKDVDTNICIDSKTELIRGFNIINDEYSFNGIIYNNKIESGSFFKIPKGEFNITIDNGTILDLDYKYLYF